MRVYLIRHGQTRGNLEKRYVGSTDESLTCEGAEKLLEKKEEYPSVEMVFSSGKKRCLETAQILFPGIPCKVVKGLEECDFGEFEYENYQSLNGDPRYQEWIDSGGRIPFPGGESRDEFQERCCSAFVEACGQAQEAGIATAAFVVHGGTIMAVLDRFSRPHRDYYDWQVKNGQGYEMEWEDGVLKRPVYEECGLGEQYVIRKNKKLRCGYTTGSCAAAAAKAAAGMLFTGRECPRVKIRTPKGILLNLKAEDPVFGQGFTSCAVRKYAGDDPDATDGLLIYARAEYSLTAAASFSSDPVIEIEGGRGVGRVTKPGLDQPVGAAAINRVPREMIRWETEEVCREHGYFGGLKITISVPEGEKTAVKTFNPHLGIEGGISILGTSGIVKPMSEEALIASIHTEMKQKKALGEEYLLITPGNYGESFIRSKEVSRKLDAESSMKCSNYVGETVDMAVQLGVKGILFIAHIGKFIKVSGGIMNTHSANGDCRAELMASQAVRAGASLDLIKKILGTNTTEEAVGLLLEEGICGQVMEETAKRIYFYLQKRCGGALATEVILYSNQHGFLGQTPGAEAMIQKIIKQKEQGG